MPPSPPTPPSASLLAFLRGIERRAFVLLRAHTGDDEVALTALLQALREFVPASREASLPHWPMLFWTSVLRQPQLLGPLPGPAPLAGLSPGPRAALLLRLVAGLDFEHAAQVLGVGEPAFRVALDRALGALAQQQVDLDALRDDLHEQTRQLSERQRAVIATVRDSVLQSAPVTPTAPDSPAPAPTGRRLRAAAMVGLALLLVALAATWIWPLSPRLQPGQSEALPPVAAGALPALDDAAVVTHPDYAQLAAAEDAAVAERLAFYSWLAAGGANAPPASAAEALPEAPEGAGVGAETEAQP